MQRIVIRISGAPRGKARTRPNFNKQGPQRFIKPKGDRIAEAVIIQAWTELGEPRIEEDVALRILLVNVHARPQSHFKKSGELSATGVRNPIPRNKKPDVDNALKLVMDSMNKRAYKDDVLIAEAATIRRWGEWEETLIVIEPIHEPVE